MFNENDLFFVEWIKKSNFFDIKRESSSLKTLTLTLNLFSSERDRLNRLIIFFIWFNMLYIKQSMTVCIVEFICYVMIEFNSIKFEYITFSTMIFLVTSVIKKISKNSALLESENSIEEFLLINALFSKLKNLFLCWFDDKYFDQISSKFEINVNFCIDFESNWSKIESR